MEGGGREGRGALLERSPPRWLAGSEGKQCTLSQKGFGSVATPQSHSSQERGAAGLPIFLVPEARSVCFYKRKVTNMETFRGAVT